jgi:hypothetical protein
VELFNRRHIMFAVVGASGLALAVDKFVLSDGLSSPAHAAAGEVVGSGSPNQRGTDAAKSSEAKPQLSPASRLAVYRKASQASLAAGVSTDPGAGTPRDAMAYPGWVVAETAQPAIGSGLASASVGGNVFVLSGVASNSVRLKREGDPTGMERGRVLKVGDQIAWSPEAGVAVRLVSIADNRQSAIIEVDGERRELRWAGEALSPGSTIRVEKAPDPSDKP